MEHLPPPVFVRIAEFALGSYEFFGSGSGYTEDLVSDTRDLPILFFHDFTRVSKTWNALIQELVKRCRQTTFEARFKDGSEKEFQAIRQRIEQRGPHIMDLRIHLTDYEAITVNNKIRWAVSVSSAYWRGDRIEWDAMLVHLVNLRRLDLSRMSLASPHVIKVVELSAKFCPKLEALILPGYHSPELGVQRLPTEAEVGPLLDAVYGGLPKWRQNGRPGLLQLVVPALNDDGRFSSCEQFIENIIAHCPNVEYLDGYMQSLRAGYGECFICWQYWPLRLTTWTAFNATCTNLREFNWIVVPFADPFFRVFGEYMKPRLKKLVFGVNMLWSWKKYFAVIGDTFELPVASRNGQSLTEPLGYGVHATDVSSALGGCPALEKVRVKLYERLDPYSDRIFTYINPKRCPRRDVLNKDVFGDDFCAALAANCPFVSKFVMVEVQGYCRSPIRAFTDAGLASLAKLKFLTKLCLVPISCTGKGLFDFLNGLSDEFLGPR